MKKDLFTPKGEFISFLDLLELNGTKLSAGRN